MEKIKINKVALISIFVIVFFYATEIQGSLIRTQYGEAMKNLTLEEKVELQQSVVHWYPYQRIIYHETEDGLEFARQCPPGSSIDDFPQFFTREQRLQGIIAIHFAVALYLFITLAFICDKYFLPAVERICEVLKISPDVAATTFMAMATTIPEFFNNTISIFIAESEMGLGAIIGGMLFNTLAVAAAASLFTKKPIQIDWWPITRDSILFSINISILVAMSWDGVIMWWEATILVVLYVGYWVLMFQNPRLMKFFKHIVEDRLLWCQRIKNYDIINQRPKDQPPPPIAPNENQVERGLGESFKAYTNQGFSGSQGEFNTVTDLKAARERSDSITSHPRHSKERRASFDLTRINETEEEIFKVWEIPKNVKWYDTAWYFLTWPIRFLLHYTIPDPVVHKKWFVASFILCIVWIAAASYVVFWMVVVIGDTFGVPEPIMGFTLLAFGACMPEAITAVIVARSGSGQMGVSNALGANSLNILFCLGVPWFIRTMADGAGFGSTPAFVNIYSYGIEFTIMGLLIAVALLYITISALGYKLRKTAGGILACSYLLLATFGILMELDFFLEPTERCPM